MNRRLFLGVSLLVLIPAFLVRGEEVAKAKDGVTHVDAAGAKKLLEKREAEGKVIVLDVRTPAEYSTGHLKDAKNIDFRSELFKAELSKLDRDKPYLVHCRSGGRSGASLDVFKELGFKRLFHLDGGMLGWEEAGYPVVRAEE